MKRKIAFYHNNTVNRAQRVVKYYTDIYLKPIVLWPTSINLKSSTKPHRGIAVRAVWSASVFYLFLYTTFCRWMGISVPFHVYSLISTLNCSWMCIHYVWTHLTHCFVFLRCFSRMSIADKANLYDMLIFS